MKIAGLETQLPAAAAKETGKTEGFGGVLAEAVGKVEALQNQADGEATKVARGEGNLHELSLSLEKADVAMRVAVKVRNKLVDAYNEVMRMSV
ncbi:MAG: flagellar hook-basal body complex protein FliE [Myxococcaceae bacterium]|nr:flagellar hook-basal body complex protein FliE [Myxococcaceae bacterium]